ncbi:phospholipase D1/2 [Nitrobacteraceae bacterium AZCC 1564]
MNLITDHSRICHGSQEPVACADVFQVLPLSVARVSERMILLKNSAIFVPGETVWKTCEAGRAAVLHDAADYFAALRSALLLAEKQVFIVGWDIHSETRLVGPTGATDDGYPVKLGEFLAALVGAKPDLHINILIWDFAALYAAEREINSAQKFAAHGRGRISILMDSTLPLGSAQHQKFVVIDRSIAFSGGLDLTIRRWDTNEHLAENPLRRDPQGSPYLPFHDIQCVVDGEAARALEVLATTRWTAAGGKVSEVPLPLGDRWPGDIPVQARNISVGIARTEPKPGSGYPVHEVFELFQLSIRSAKDLIYIENQFISAPSVAKALAQRMVDCPTLRVLIVTPRRHSSWLESQAMQGGRSNFLAPFVEANVIDRLRILYPAVRGKAVDVPVMVHSKLMTVDDHFLRIGSANLNNRSLGADTECDLAFEATMSGDRKFIRETRNSLIGHFCGVDASVIAAHEADLFEFIDRRSKSDAGRRLLPVRIDVRGTWTDVVQSVADPREPLHLERTARRLWTGRTITAVAAIALLLVGLALAWRYTFLRSYTDVTLLSDVIARHSQSIFAPLFVIAAFLLGGLVVFPVTVLIAATAAALGPFKGFATAALGVLLSASLVFMIGRFVGHRRLQSLLGARALRIQRQIVGKGIMAVAMIRMVPIAPFSIVNVLAGASQLKFRDFIVGTALGMAPGIVAMAALGAQIAEFARHASWSSTLLLGLIIALWLVLCVGVQFLVTWLAERRK